MKMTGALDKSKEEQILDAATEVLLEQGLAGARMQEIANHAGINKTLLHYYFRSKENIYRRVVERIFGGFFGQMEAILTSEESLPAALRGFIEGFFAVLTANPKVPNFMMQELSRGGKAVQEIMTTVLSRTKLTLPQHFVGLMRREQEAGTIAPVNPYQFLVTLLGACTYYFAAEPIVRAVIRASELGRVTSRERFIEERKEEIFNVLYYGLKKRKGKDAR